MKTKNNWVVYFTQGKHGYNTEFYLPESAISFANSNAEVLISIISENELKFIPSYLDNADTVTCKLYNDKLMLLKELVYSGKLSLESVTNKSGYYRTRFKIILDYTRKYTKY